MISRFKDSLRALFGASADSDNPDAKLGACEAYKAVTIVELSTSANAATNTDWQYFGVGSQDCSRKVIGARFWPDAALDLSSDNGTNYAQLKIIKDDGAGGTNTVVASVSTSGSATNFVVGVPYDLTVACSLVDEDEVLALSIRKGGTGHAIVAGRFEVFSEAI